MSYRIQGKGSGVSHLAPSFLVSPWSLDIDSSFPAKTFPRHNFAGKTGYPTPRVTDVRLGKTATMTTDLADEKKQTSATGQSWMSILGGLGRGPRVRGGLQQISLRTTGNFGATACRTPGSEPPNSIASSVAPLSNAGDLQLCHRGTYPALGTALF